MSGRDHRFTIYDAMEKAGKFDSNPANTFARDKTTGANIYSGPQPFPKMLYHPEGLEQITNPAEIVTTPLGAKEVGEQRQLVYKIVGNAEEEEALRASGWHDHPAKAIRARLEATGGDLSKVPPMSSDQRIKDLEREIARLSEVKGKEDSQRAADLSNSGKPATPKTGAALLAERTAS